MMGSRPLSGAKPCFRIAALTSRPVTITSCSSEQLITQMTWMGLSEPKLQSISSLFWLVICDEDTTNYHIKIESKNLPERFWVDEKSAPSMTTQKSIRQRDPALLQIPRETGKTRGETCVVCLLFFNDQSFFAEVGC